MPNKTTPAVGECYIFTRPYHRWRGCRVAVAAVQGETITVVLLTALQTILTDLAKGKTPAPAIKLAVTADELYPITAP